VAGSERVLDELARESARTDAVRAQARQRAHVTEVPTRKFVRAAAAWLGLSFALCYVALPLMIDGAGLRSAYLPLILPSEIIGMGVASGWLLLRVLRRGWRGSLDLELPALATDDRIPAAALGGLLMWGLLHNVLPGLEHMGQMSMAFLLVFGLANVLENVLFGTVLGTIAENRRQAFVMGGTFQLLLLGVAWMV
jgi:hypothetical protein